MERLFIPLDVINFRTCQSHQFFPQANSLRLIFPYILGIPVLHSLLHRPRKLLFPPGQDGPGSLEPCPDGRNLLVNSSPGPFLGPKGYQFPVNLHSRICSLVHLPYGTQIILRYKLPEPEFILRDRSHIPHDIKDFQDSGFIYARNDSGIPDYTRIFPARETYRHPVPTRHRAFGLWQGFHSSLSGRITDM